MIQSPKIKHISWGSMEIEGNIKGKDFILYPGGVERWNWKDSGTDHGNGIQIDDVEKVLKHGAKKIILSQGMLGRLRVSREAINLLKETGTEYKIMKTKEAVEEYNNSCDKIPVGGLFHSTC